MRLRSSTRAITVSCCLVLAAMAAASTGFAQTRAEDAAEAPALKLSTAQRQTIFQSVSGTQKNNAAPTGFRAAVGALVPPAIELRPVSNTVATLVPQTSGYAAAMVEKQVMLVNPSTRQVVAVVTGQP